jgi:hypothetical protein
VPPIMFTDVQSNTCLLLSFLIRHSQDFCRGICSMVLLGAEGLAGFVAPAVVRVFDSIGKKTMNESYSHVSYIASAIGIFSHWQQESY